MRLKELIKPRSLFLAPMEGITDDQYRHGMYLTFNEWDYFVTDFLRVPTVAPYPNWHINEHFGNNSLKNPNLKNKTIFQILSPASPQLKKTVEQINELGFKWIDLNLGCPSRTVNGHGGGSYLLQDLENLRKIVKEIRQNFPFHFSAKIRLGYKDDSNFEEILKLLEEEGVELITIHARTKVQMYKGIADWSYIKKAVETVKIPIVGNGDIWTLEDIEKIFEYTNCHSLMLARSALKTPWLAKLHHHHRNEVHNTEFLLNFRIKQIPLYFSAMELQYRNEDWQEHAVLKKFKALSRYIFDDFQNPEELKRKFLRATTLDQFKEEITLLKN